MATDDEYDSSLTGRIQTELDGMGTPSAEERAQLGRLISRLDGEFRSLLAEPSRRVGTMAFLGGPTPGISASAAGPLRGALTEMVTLSKRLDHSTDPAQGFSLAESVAHRAHEISHTVEGFLPAVDPEDAIVGRFGRLTALLSELIRNAVTKMRAFARLLGVSSFAVTFGTTPPQVSVTFSFDIPPG